MKIGVLSDTHSRELPSKMLSAFKGVDIIVHAGDICCEETLNFLKKINEVKAVSGNMDELSIKELLPDHLTFNVEEVTVGVFHGKGPSKDALSAAKEMFEDTDVDIVIFGHSHIPFNQKIKGVLFFNPGSPNDTIFAPYCSYGLIEIDKDQISSQIICV